jgi:hypothetical protein
MQHIDSSEVPMRARFLLPVAMSATLLSGCDTSSIAGTEQVRRIAPRPAAFFDLGPASADRYGVNVIGLTDVGGPDDVRRTVGVVRQGGFKWARLPFWWVHMQPTGPTFDPAVMSKYRVAVQALLDSGITPYVTLEYTPPWPRHCDYEGQRPDCTQFHPPASDMWIWWRNFVGATLDSFPEINHWGIWNEPNIDYFLRPLPDTTWFDAYFLLYAYAADAIHARSGKIMAGPELADGTSSRGWSPEAEFSNWVSRMNYMIRPQDVITVHRYNNRAGLVSLLQNYSNSAQAAGLANKVWVTEMGAGDTEWDDGHQSRQNMQFYQAMDHDIVPRWTKTFKFHMWDDAGFGLRLLNNVPSAPSGRPAYYCLQSMARQTWEPSGCTAGSVSISGPFVTSGGCRFNASTSLGTGPVNWRWKMNGQVAGGNSSVLTTGYVGTVTLSVSVLDGGDASAFTVKECRCTSALRVCYE